MRSHEDFHIKFWTSEDYQFEMRHYQQSDNIIALAIKLFKEKDKSKWKDEDLDLLREWEFVLYLKLINGDLLIENHILKCWHKEEKWKKRHKLIFVPFYLRGKLIDHIHHNVIQHHYSFE